MVTFLLAALALAAQAPATPAQRPTGVSLVDCRLGRINFETMRPEAETHRFVLLLGAPQGDRHAIEGPEQVRVFDPANLLMGHALESARYSDDPNMLFAQTNSDQPVHFRLAVSLPTSAAGLGMNGSGSQAEHMAHSYMGDCSIGEPADAAQRFEAMRAGQ